MRALSGLMAGVTLATTCTGCFSTWDLSPREVTRLHGYQEPQVVTLADTDGGEVRFDRATELRFYDQGGELLDKAKFSSIQVNGPSFTGMARGDVRPVSVDLAHVGEIKARKFSIGKTIGVGVGVPAGVILVTTIILVAVVASTVPVGGVAE